MSYCNDIFAAIDYYFKIFIIIRIGVLVELAIIGKQILVHPNGPKITPYPTI